MQDQNEFIALDGVMCSVAAVALTLFHPGFCFPRMAQPIGFGRRKLLSTMNDGRRVDSAYSASSDDLYLEEADIAKPGGLYLQSELSVLAESNPSWKCPDKCQKMFSASCDSHMYQVEPYS